MKWNKGMLVYNGNAGQEDVTVNLGICVPLLSSAVKELTLLPTQVKGDAEKLCKQYGEDMDVLFILGGDGTVHECINGISALTNRPTIGILPGGTCNDFSRELNIPQEIEEATKCLLEGQSKRIDVGKVNDNYFLNFVGLGLIADTSSNIDGSQKNLLGKMSYFISAIKTVKDTNPFSYRLEYNGNIIEDEALLILVANGNYIGTNKLPFKEISSSDGLLDIVIVKNSNFALFKEILFSSTYKLPEDQTDRELVYLQSKYAQITTLHSMDVDTDGELYLQTPINVKILPQHLRFICNKEL